MGNSSNVAEFSRKITNLATVTQRKNRETVLQGALTAKTIMLGEATARGISPTSRIAGGRWSVGFDIIGFNNPSALVRYRGPFHLVDRPTSPHTITPRRRRARGKRPALRLPDGQFRRVVHHPGTPGKGSFDAARVKARIAVPRVMAQRTIGVWRAAFK